LIDKGYSQKEVADIVGASQNTISTWKRNYKKFGMKGLKILSLKQETIIQNIIVDKN